MNPLCLRLYLITDRQAIGEKDFYECLEQALKGGISMVQLREKTISGKDFYTSACQVKDLCCAYKVPLIINDRIDIACAVDADGVHLGPNDIPIHRAREILGRDKIIGGTARTLEMAIEAAKQGADYLGCGALFQTTTKKDIVPMSIERLNEIIASVHIPIVAVGGINKQTIDSILDIKVQGYAVSSGILKNSDIHNTSKILKGKISKSYLYD